MPEPTIIHSTFVIERSYPASAERLFTAFSNPGQKRVWFANSANNEPDLFESDFRVGGTDRLRYCIDSGPLKGSFITNEGTYQDIVPNQRIITASHMSLGDKRISASLVTIELIPTSEGTDLICTHQGAFLEGSGGPQMREQGWHTLFDRLATLLAQQPAATSQGQPVA